MTAIRSFIAIPLPEQTQQKIGEIIEQFEKGIHAQVRWVQPQNIHLTLKFLGDVSPSNLQYLKNILQAQADELQPFTFTIGGLGAFPDTRHPRVIWIGVKAPDVLYHLQSHIETETHKLGYASELRKFSPHLTLGRISRNASPAEVRELSDTISSMKIGQVDTVHVEAIHLFRSDLKPGGAVYSSLFIAPLFAEKIDKI